MSALRHIVCQLTGSVDSAVAALLLKRKGFLVTGLFVRSPYESKTHQEVQRERACYAAKHLGITLEEIDLPSYQWLDLQRCAAAEYRAGRSPDLQLLYDKHITFGAVNDYINKSMRTNLMATEHYARTSLPEDVPEQIRLQGAHLFKGVDQYNDDSAILAQIPQRFLRMTVLPLGEFTKEIVAHIASSSGLGTLLTDSMLVQRKDLSMFREAVLKEVPATPGVFRNLETYNVCGTHEGIHEWSIGQVVEIDNTDFCIASKDLKTGDIMVVPGQDHLGLYTDTFFTSLAHWTFLTPYNFFEKHTMACDFRLHTHDPVVRCQLTVGAHNEWCGNDHIIVSSTQSLRCISPGQITTFYKDEEAIGSAVVLRSGPSHYAMYPHKRNNQPAKNRPGNGASPGSGYFFSPLKNFYQRLSNALST